MYNINHKSSSYNNHESTNLVPSITQENMRIKI